MQSEACPTISCMLFSTSLKPRITRGTALRRREHFEILSERVVLISPEQTKVTREIDKGFFVIDKMKRETVVSKEEVSPSAVSSVLHWR